VHQPVHVESACRDSLNRLSIEYFDLFLIHWPASLKYGTEGLPSLIDEIIQPIEHRVR
jgi:diketogulonate reductase-like aldo/keto reductase